MVSVDSRFLHQRRVTRELDPRLRRPASQAAAAVPRRAQISPGFAQEPEVRIRLPPARSHVRTASTDRTNWQTFSRPNSARLWRAADDLGDFVLTDANPRQVPYPLAHR